MRYVVAIVLMLSAVSAVPAKADTILGDTIQIQTLFPDTSTVAGTLTGVVTATGLSELMTGDGAVQVTVTPTSVQATLVCPNCINSTFDSAAFNGVMITDLTNPLGFTSFSIDSASNVVGFGSDSDVSIFGGALFINYESLVFPQGSLAQVDFTAAPRVPEPSSLLLLGTGLLGLMGMGLYKKRLA